MTEAGRKFGVHMAILSQALPLATIFPVAPLQVALDSLSELRHLIDNLRKRDPKRKEDTTMFYQTEAKPQGWCAVAVFDDRPEQLLYLNRSSTQVRAGFREGSEGVSAAAWAHC